MWLPTRERTHNVDPTLSDVMSEALRKDLTIEIVSGERSWWIEIEGIRVAPFVSESFDYPLNRYDFDSKADGLVASLLDDRRKRRYQRRKEKMNTDTQSDTEGYNGV